MKGCGVHMGKNKKWMAVGLATAVTLSGWTTVMQPSAVYAESGFPFNQDAKKAYEAVLPLVIKAEKTRSEKDVTAAYQAFIKITDKLSIEDVSMYEEGNELDMLYERLKMTLYAMPKTYQDKEIPKMANKWVEEVRKSLNSVMKFYLIDLIDTNTNKSIDDELKLVNRKLDFYMTVKDPTVKLPEDWDNSLDDMYDDYVKDEQKPVSEGSVKPPGAGTPGNKPNSNASNSIPDFNQTGGGTEQVQIGDTWYEVSYSYVNGKVVQTGKKKLSRESHPYLYGYSATSSKGNDSQASEKNPFLSIDKTKLDYLTNDQNAESEYTIQYSLDKQSENPYYFDTGLRVDKNMNANYEQYKDVLYQIAVKSGGYVVEDNGRVLIVIDKKPIVVKDIKKNYSEREIEKLFEEFPNIDIRIFKTRIGLSTSLEQQVVSKQAKTVSIDGKKMEMSNSPIVRDNRVLLPLKEVSEALGATVEQQEDKFIVRKGEASVVYQLKSTFVTSKGKKVDIGIAPDVKEATLFVEMNELSKAFDYILLWDADSSELSFNKN